MSHFSYQQDQLYCEQVPLQEIAARYGTPSYVYSHAALLDNIKSYQNAIKGTPIRVFYAVKANSNLAILNIIARQQMGFDIVSLGELERVLLAKGDPKQIIFSGVGKRADEIIRAMEVGIHCFDVESAEELLTINQLAKAHNYIANIALRINPNVDALTHKYISTGLNDNKFGIHLSDIMSLIDRMPQLSNIKLTGLAFHIGSQLTSLSPILAAIDSVCELIATLKQRGILIHSLNIGGGLGVRYQDESPPSIAEYVAAIAKKTTDLSLDIMIEPGRSLIAQTGILLTRVTYLKQTQHKNFAIVDAAMNDLIRPALYDAWHGMLPVFNDPSIKKIPYDVVGPVCETADCLGQERILGIRSHDLLAMMDAGAYGFGMSSNYNSRPRIAELMVDGDHIHVIRERESIADLYQLEHLLPHK